MQSTETIYAALFAGLNTLAGTAFKTISRRLRLVEEVDSSEMPAVYQHQLTAVSKIDTLAGTALMSYTADWYVYACVPDMTVPTTPTLNALVDQLLSQFPQEGGGLQITAGGVTVNLFLNGPVEYFEGLLDTKSVARIHVSVLA